MQKIQDIRDFIGVRKIKTSEGSVAFYPMYDWNFHDIWKFIYDNDIAYSRIDYQFKKGLHQQDIRVSSLIHEKSFKALVDLPEFEPKTYDKLLKRVKGIEVVIYMVRIQNFYDAENYLNNSSHGKSIEIFYLQTYPDKSKIDIFKRDLVGIRK